jgi:hypothetical protein
MRVAIGRELRGGICHPKQSEAINVAVTFAREMPPVGIHVMVVYGAKRALSIVRPPNGSAGKNLR